ncbi:hypothetical protein B296_00036585 [Ensete ventricosum]|uniref:Plant bHLH transcription factor ACT-like domain-containing protein n=1 Tax=Ensete ventricosum TaxID=4639 RepID=A0A426XKA1_ENSVE|nr:hypothetical protein B296_00036585 [Ensete ventricosum]
MVSREHKRAAFHEKLQLLRSITHSHAVICSIAHHFYPGLLVSILEAFEKLGLSVVQARATCSDTFRLEAVGGDIQVARMDAQMVKQAVLQAIKTGTKSSDQE